MNFAFYRPKTPIPHPAVYWRHYVSERDTGRLEALSDYVRRAKVGAVTRRETVLWAKALAKRLRSRGFRPSVVVPVPRQGGDVSAPQLLAPYLARELETSDGTGLLTRCRKLRGGRTAYFRRRYTPVEHARSLCIQSRHPVLDTKLRRLLVIDDVSTTGASLEGAIRRLQRALPSSKVRGLALLGSGPVAGREL